MSVSVLLSVCAQLDKKTGSITEAHHIGRQETPPQRDGDPRLVTKFLGLCFHL